MISRREVLGTDFYNFKTIIIIDQMMITIEKSITALFPTLMFIDSFQQKLNFKRSNEYQTNVN